MYEILRFGLHHSIREQLHSCQTFECLQTEDRAMLTP
jgi:hypothetical protein